MNMQSEALQQFVVLGRHPGGYWRICSLTTARPSDTLLVTTQAA